MAVDAKPLDPEHPVVSMDEQPIQLLKKIPRVIPGTGNHAKRVDYEYERACTASIFVFCEALAGWRQVTVREQRTKVDWAHEVLDLIENRYGKASKLTLVCENLNTYTRWAIYQLIPVERARRIGKWLGLCHTKNPGNLLNITEKS